MPSLPVIKQQYESSITSERTHLKTGKLPDANDTLVHTAGCLVLSIPVALII